MRHVDANGVRIAYDDLGPVRGEVALLCLPGWCTNRGLFAALAERLALRHRVLTLDWRGHGDSSRPSTDFSHAELVADAIAVIDAADVKTVVPIAQAQGAWVATWLRRNLGARVPAVIAMSWLVLEPPPPFHLVLEGLQDELRWKESRDALFSTWTAGACPELAERVGRDVGDYDFDMWARAARSIAGEYARHGSPLRALATTPTPPPFMHLFSQPRTPEFLSVQQAFARDTPWFRVERLDALSHFPALEAPEATSDAIEAFLRRSRVDSR